MHFNCSKIPDVYDSAKYDLIHNAQLDHILPRDTLLEVYILARSLAVIVIPAEYGVNPEMKLKIGQKICGKLLGR